MKTSVLLLVLCIAVIVLLCFPEDTNAVVFVLSRGKIRSITGFKRSSVIKRKKQRAARRKRRKKKHHKRASKYRDVRRWLKRFDKKKRKWLKRVMRKNGGKKSKRS